VTRPCALRGAGAEGPFLLVIHRLPADGPGVLSCAVERESWKTCVDHTTPPDCHSIWPLERFSVPAIVKQHLFRFSWKWRRRSPIKLMERTHEEATKAIAPEEKAAILRRHLLEKEPISKLCDEVGLQPTVFYRWQKEFFENGAAAFEQRRPTNPSADQ
jgi:hypothetical protein